MRGRRAHREHVLRERLSHERRRRDRIRLRVRGLLAFHMRGRNTTVLDREERLSGRALENVDVTRLGDLRDGVDFATVARHGDQCRRGGEVPVPQVVLYRLEMPETLSGFRIEREQRVGEQIVPDTVRAVEVECRRAGGGEHDAALLIDGDARPGVRATGDLPRIGRPRIVSELAGARDRVKDPA